jgi:hypothetical protein
MTLLQTLVLSQVHGERKERATGVANPSGKRGEEVL